MTRDSPIAELIVAAARQPPEHGISTRDMGIVHCSEQGWGRLEAGFITKTSNPQSIFSKAPVSGCSHAGKNYCSPPKLAHG